MSKTNYQKLELNEKLVKSVLAELELELAPLLAKAEEDGQEESSDAPPAEASAESASEESAPPAAADESAPPAEESAPPAPAEDAPPMDAAPEATPPAAPVDPMAFLAGLKSMPVEQLKAIYMAVKQELLPKMQAEQSASMAPPMAPPAAAPAAPMAPPAAPPMALKGEASMTSSPADGNDATTAKKSEDSHEVTLLKAELSAQNQKLDLVARALEMTLMAPQRKAITSMAQIAHIAKSEVEAAPMSKSEIDAKLKTVIRDPKLAKKDREQITAYYDSNRASLAGIQHLLK